MRQRLLRICTELVHFQSSATMIGKVSNAIINAENHQSMHVFGSRQTNHQRGAGKTWMYVTNRANNAHERVAPHRAKTTGIHFEWSARWKIHAFNLLAHAPHMLDSPPHFSWRKLSDSRFFHAILVFCTTTVVQNTRMTLKNYVCLRPVNLRMQHFLWQKPP